MSRTEALNRDAFHPDAFVRLFRALHEAEELPGLHVSYGTIENGPNAGVAVVTVRGAGVIATLPYDAVGRLRATVAAQVAKTGCPICGLVADALAQIIDTIDGLGGEASTIH